MFAKGIFPFFLWASMPLFAAGAPSKPQDCALLGPDFPVPRKLASSPLLEQAKQTFNTLLSNNSAARSNDTAWSVSLFSTTDNGTLFEKHYTPPSVQTSSVGVRRVDGDSAYRLGSLSKVFTVWTFLAHASDVYFNHPVTQYVPELANPKLPPLSDGVVYDDLNSIRWDDVTLGNLASQQSGMIRDVTFGDLSVPQPGQPSIGNFGQPPANETNVPTCGNPLVQPPCSRTEFLNYLIESLPMFPTSHTPAYTNIAYQVLAYALEAITKRDFNDLITNGIFKPLGMTHSGFKTPANASFAVIPGSDPISTGWNVDAGVDGPGGGVYASTNDLVKAGKSMLSSSILSPAQTRRWLRPLAHTADIRSSVGAPWQIRRLQSSNNRVTDLYTKDGDIASYHALLVLSPDHEVGMTVTAVGSIASDLRTSLGNILVDTFLPAIEEAARQEAKSNLAGTYSDPNSNSTVTITSDSRMGLGISSLVSRGKPTLDIMAAVQKIPSVSPRLYPSTLKTVSKRSTSGGPDGTFVSRLGFRAVFLPELPTTEDFQEGCVSWFGVAAVRYGGVPIDDWVFELGEDGTAKTLDVRGLKLKLQRQSQ